ncbi:hypothetical protein KAW18_11450 [candidate division WOR-3 bacterium]|nr:hypothetical protein [candidate division WOR-3 bacterium]
MKGNIVAGIIGFIYLTLAGIAGGGEFLLVVFIYLVFALGLIWFAKDLGEYTGTVKFIQLTSKSPGFLVRIVGWMLLLLPVGIVIYWAIIGV